MCALTHTHTHTLVGFAFGVGSHSPCPVPRAGVPLAYASRHVTSDAHPGGITARTRSHGRHGRPRQKQIQQFMSFSARALTPPIRFP